MSSGRLEAISTIKAGRGVMNSEEMLTILKSLDDELENADAIHPDHRKSLQLLTQEIQKKFNEGFMK